MKRSFLLALGALLSLGGSAMAKDCVTVAGRVVEVTATGWRVTQDAPVRFRRERQPPVAQLRAHEVIDGVLAPGRLRRCERLERPRPIASA